MNDQKNNIFASTCSTYTSDIGTSGGNALTTNLNNINNDPFVISTRSQFLLSPQPEFSHSQFLHGQHLLVETQQSQPFFPLNPHPSHHRNEPITPQQNNQANTINSNMSNMNNMNNIVDNFVTSSQAAHFPNSKITSSNNDDNDNDDSGNDKNNIGNAFDLYPIGLLPPQQQIQYPQSLPHSQITQQQRELTASNSQVSYYDHHRNGLINPQSSDQTQFVKISTEKVYIPTDQELYDQIKNNWNWEYVDFLTDVDTNSVRRTNSDAPENITYFRTSSIKSELTSFSYKK
nr:6942_t:CDS:2 [Entrophospora candida]